MNDTKLSLNAFKTQPKSILKSQSRTKTTHRTKQTLFYSGEPLVIENDLGCEESPETIFPDKKIENSFLNQDSLVSLSKTNIEERFKKSSITRKSTSKRKRRAASDKYILHSIEINKEIIKNLLKSIDEFMEEFKEKLGCEYFSDRDIMIMYKEKFLAELKVFLVSPNTFAYLERVNKEQLNYSYEIGVALSEPNILELKNLRNINHKEKLLHAESTANIKKYYANEPGNVYGSLPANNYFDSISQSLESQLSTKSLNSSINFEEEKPANSNKSIISTASTTKKIVRFADSFGFDLEKVKIIASNSFADLFSQNDCATDEENDQQQPQASNKQSFQVLLPLFSLRKADKELYIKLDDFVYDYENKIIRCMVKVKNISFNKRVFARITLNNWKSFYDLNAVYVKTEHLKNVSNETDSEICNFKSISFDLFGFSIIIPEKISENAQEKSSIEESTLRIEFALCYQTNNETFWDNNSNINYKFQCFYNRN